MPAETVANTVLERRGAGDALEQAREVGQQVDPGGRLLVQACVLDGARDERCGVLKEVQVRANELVRSLRVEGDDAHDVAVAPEHRDGYERLEAFFLELREVLHP